MYLNAEGMTIEESRNNRIDQMYQKMNEINETNIQIIEEFDTMKRMMGYSSPREKFLEKKINSLSDLLLVIRILFIVYAIITNGKRNDKGEQV